MGQRALWIFGYGSLIWRPSFQYDEARPAWIHGWARRFWQGSTDHRGVPGAPGRVVTLLPDSRATCWGMAYAIAAPDRPAVLAELDDRERGGYARSDVELNFDAARPATGTMYIATPENPNYLGPARVDEIAEQVTTSVGPSGPNTEYVERLANSLRSMGAEDAHVFAIADAVARTTASA